MDIETPKADFEFKPVVVEGGRKFRGKAFFLGHKYDRVNSYGVRGSKMWTPEAGFVYATTDYLVDDPTVTEEEISTARSEFIEFVKKYVVEYATKKLADLGPTPDDPRVKYHARQTLIKYYPSVFPFLEKDFPDMRDAYSEIEKTLDWAMKLCSRPAVIYGKVCKGGRPYPDRKRVGIAWSAVHNKKINLIEGFAEAWDMQMTIRGLQKYNPMKKA